MWFQPQLGPKRSGKPSDKRDSLKTSTSFNDLNARKIKGAINYPGIRRLIYAHHVLRESKLAEPFAWLCEHGSLATRDLQAGRGRRQLCSQGIPGGTSLSRRFHNFWFSITRNFI